ncbi:AgmX/PglI C-terminal domain-containing protein [Mangrovimicrobium sediminis]|uniref:AgmX/PglI C-terminal domain-containing protein n=1 Tax=Mangrovimicrobium sediminis TaxID=2562682 RepID=A0A4Z0M8L5_9GAMM|nr:AgmX/PglI C-terminal domain-containing protein [Haliea sp. SAOS-164]TGD75635.1 AgmX/PglI C-terminal domain-containing protein [Haliea sp. SAOS-164]
MGAALSPVELVLPWESGEGEDRRFGMILAAMLALFLVVAVAVPLIEVPDLALEEPDAEPEVLARVLIEEKELPKPEPVEPKPKEKPKPKPKPKDLPPVPAQAVQVEPIDLQQQARDDALAAGVLAFKDDLMDMRDTLDVDDLDRAQTSRGETAAAQVERSVITANTAGSGGITTADLSRDAGGPALSGREATKVHSNIADDASANANAAGSANSRGKGQSASLGGRSDAAIRQVMDRNKGAIFAVYNRALREDPLLQGKLVFEMVIEPDGRISSLTLVSSELQDADLTQKILTRIRMINFGTQNVRATRVNYAFDFLPYG